MGECRIYQDMIMEALADELPQEDRDRLQEHLRSCGDCAREFREMQAMLTTVAKREPPALPGEFWEGYWDRLQQRDGGSPPSLPVRKAHIPRWILWPTAAAFLIAGLFIGRFFHSDAPERAGKHPESARGLAARPQKAATLMYSLQDYFQELEPLLIDWSQDPAILSGSGTETVTVDRDRLEQLLLQNILFRRALARASEPIKRELLEELRFVLLEMSGSSSDPERLADVRRMIAERDLLFRMRVLKRTGRSL